MMKINVVEIWGIKRAWDITDEFRGDSVSLRQPKKNKTRSSRMGTWQRENGRVKILYSILKF
jgi:hypothetical protein